MRTLLLIMIIGCLKPAPPAAIPTVLSEDFEKPAGIICLDYMEDVALRQAGIIKWQKGEKANLDYAPHCPGEMMQNFCLKKCTAIAVWLPCIYDCAEIIK